MKRTGLFLFVFLFSVALSVGGQGLTGEETLSTQTPSGITEESVNNLEPLAGGMDARISLDLRNIEVVDALQYLSQRASMNLVMTKNVTGRVSLRVENVPVKDIFDVMLRSNGLAYSKPGEIYNIMTEAEYRALFGKRFDDIREVKMFRIQYAIPEQVFSLLDTLKSEIGRVLVEPDSGTAVVMDTPETIKEMEKAMASLEQRNTVKVFNLEYANATEVTEQLKEQLDAKKVGSIRADERSNQVIIQALPERMAEIETLIKALDQKTKRVLIDVKIIKVKLSDQMTQGIEWEGLVDIGSQFGMMYFGSVPFSVMKGATAVADWTGTWASRNQFREGFMPSDIGAYPQTPPTAGKISPGTMHIGSVTGKRDYDVLVKYLQTLGRTQILSNPKLSVVNNHEAKIHVGERQAYVTTTTTTGQATSTIAEDVQFVDVGIQIAVTPTINEEGYITMRIKPEISSVVSYLITPTNNKIPIIDTSMAETTVMVKDGHTVIIGGLRKEEKSSDSEGIPYLSKIPVLGFLFKEGGDKTERTELLVMMTPHVAYDDTLDTGNEREFDKIGKDYEDYAPIRSKKDGDGGSLADAAKEPEEVTGAVSEPEVRIKPYM